MIDENYDVYKRKVDENFTDYRNAFDKAFKTKEPDYEVVKMKKRKRNVKIGFIAILAIIMLLLTLTMALAIPLTLDQQGVLRNATSGAAITGTYTFNITLYNVSNDAVLYSELSNINVQNGIWNNYIGLNNTLSSEYFKHNTYIITSINGETLSRVNLTSVPYAFYSLNSNNSDYLNGQPASYYLDDTDTIWNITGSQYIYNNSGVLDINETVLNLTIDSRLPVTHSHNQDLDDSSNVTFRRIYMYFNSTVNKSSAYMYYYGDTAIGVSGTLIAGTLQSQNNIYAVGYIYSDSDLYTSGAGDDLWLGNTTQASALFRAYATGQVNAKNITLTDGIYGNLNASYIQNAPWLTSFTETGDISAVVAGTGLTGGADSGSATLNLNTTYTDTLYAKLSGIDGSNITSGTVADARIASTITRDSEVPSLETDAAHDSCSEISGCVVGAITDGNTNWDNTYGFINLSNITAGQGITITSGQINHTDTSSQATSDNSARTYIQDITLDTFGHITSIATATETVTDTDTKMGTSGAYLYNDSTLHYFNETKLNSTIQALSDIDTNETTRVNNIVSTDCTAGNFVYGFETNGTPICDAPAGSGDMTAVYTDNKYLTGGAPSGDVNITVNETYLNNTIIAITDARDTDTTYTAGTGLILSSTTFSVNTTYLDANYVGQSEYTNLDTDSTNDVTSVTGDTYISVSGTATRALAFNETKLNATIDVRASGFTYSDYFNQNLNTTSNVIFNTLNITTLNLGATGLLYTGTGSAHFGGGGDTGDRLEFDGGGNSIQWNNFAEWYMPVTGDINFQRWSESGTTKFVAGAGGGAWHNVYVQNNLTVDGTIFGNINASYIQNAPSSWTTDTDTKMGTDGIYLYNSSTIHYLNETKLNATITSLVGSTYATNARVDIVNATAVAALPKAGGTITGNVIVNDNIKIYLGSDSDVYIMYNATGGYGELG